MNENNILFNKLSHIFFMCCLVTTVIFLLYIKVNSSRTAVSLNDNALYNLNTNWHYTLVDSHTTYDLSLPAHLNLPSTTNSLTLERTLNEASPHANYLLLRSSEQSLHVWIDNKLLYSYDISSPIGFENHTASAWHFIELPSTYNYNTSHQLTLQLYSPLSANVGIVNEVYIGSQIACLYMLFKTYGFSWLTCLLLFLLGLTLLSYSFLSLFKSRHHTPLFYLGAFATCAAIWSASEGRLLQFIFSHRQLEYYLNYCLLFILPIPFLFYIKLNYAFHFTWLYDILIWLFGLNFMICITLVIFNVKNFFELQLTFQLLLIITLTLCSITFFSTIKQQQHTNKLAILGYLCLIFTAALDLLRVYTGMLIDSSFAFRIGLLIFIITTSFDFEQHLLEVSLQSRRTQILETLAYTDTMTGLLNRTAFNEALNRINDMLPISQPIALLILDINDLKLANDTLGHTMGDLLITHTATLLKQVYHDIANIYRIGGDEFVVIFEGIPESALKHYLQKFKHELQLHNSMQSPKISTAYGYAYYNANVHQNIHDVFIAADENMYACKKSYKLQTRWVHQK